MRKKEKQIKSAKDLIVYQKAYDLDSSFLKYLHTIRYLKFRQIGYRVFYLLRRCIRKLSGHKYLLFVPGKTRRLFLQPVIEKESSCAAAFTFLNRSHRFEGPVDWNFAGYGKLWAYNLNYFDFLNQGSGMDRELGLALIRAFIGQLTSDNVGTEPFPTSLRIINWVKFLTRYDIRDSHIDASLLAQSKILQDNLEYHLLGNHLLENAFALLFSAYYYEDKQFYKRAVNILKKELEVQILPDGGHFELSPMYHQIILDRLLDCINLAKNNAGFGRDLIGLLEAKAAMMLSWLRQITFGNGDIPLVNDAANNIAPTSAQLFDYAEQLNLKEAALPLGASGYRKIVKDNYELFVDVGPIGPDYIPGHAHSDTFSFELYTNGHPFIVDTGTSTYEDNALRFWQKSTRAHNTVQIGYYDQTEVWSSFRVARRAHITERIESGNEITVSHNGYNRIGAEHHRRFQHNQDSIMIMDEVKMKHPTPALSFLHFHPDIDVRLENNTITAGAAIITLGGAEKISIEPYDYAPAFNRLIPSRVAVVHFYRFLKTEIRFS